MPSRRSKATGVIPQLANLNPRAQATHDALLGLTINERTEGGYRRIAQRFIREYGSLEPARFIDYLADLIDTGKETSPAVATLRHEKSALVHYAAAVLNEPWTPDASRRIDVLLGGYGKWHGARKKRGTLTHAQTQAVIAEARALNQLTIAEGITVLYNIICRPRDIEEIECERVDLQERVVYVRRKAWTPSVIEDGELEPHDVVDQETWEILARRYVFCMREAERLGLDKPPPLFGTGWNIATANRILKRVAERDQWPDTVVYDGIHCIRHAGATNVYLTSIEAPRRQGGWATTSSARHYSQAGRVPTRVEATTAAAATAARVEGTIRGRRLATPQGRANPRARATRAGADERTGTERRTSGRWRR